MPVSVFFRQILDSGATRYVFFPADKIQFLFDTQLDPINLMGNTAGGVFGGGSNNILIKLGTIVGTIRIEGTLTSMDEGSVPSGLINIRTSDDPPASRSPNVSHLYYDGSVTATPDYNKLNAVHLRQTLLNITADQPTSDVQFGWPRWLDTTDEGDPFGVSSIGEAQIFSGAIKLLRIQEQAGEIKQFPYVIEFVVGKGERTSSG